MLKFSEDREGVYWDKPIELGLMRKFNNVFIDLYACDAAGITEDMAKEEKLSRISKYYGDRFKELEADVKYINEQFLMWIVTHLCDIEYPFGEFGSIDKSSTKYPDYIVEEEMKKFEDESGQVIHDYNAPSPVYKKIQEYNMYDNKDNLTSYEIIAKYLPVLDFEKLVATIEPDSLDTYEEEIHFQVSSKVCGGMLLCATYGTIHENNKLEVTHNC
ncbi:hypothetical protein [Clostridium beijerinckii]|uniref:hypothetical protein n=1 Tax=Clostridium beijerinckii TaxID=1520 RepID=UPI00080A43B2|nr:hypothetical protein [Clostridium beijerinckii]OCA98721.1 hypothetical protein BGS1_22830 [Clostridium beijerinckii]